MSDDRQERQPESTGRHLAAAAAAPAPRGTTPRYEAPSFDDDSPFVDTSLFEAALRREAAARRRTAPRREAAPPPDDDSPFVDDSLFAAALRQEAASQQEAAPRRERTPRREAPSRDETAPRRERASRKEARSRQRAASRKETGAPQEDAPEREDAPRSEDVPRRRRRAEPEGRREKASRHAGESRAARRRRKMFRTFLLVYLAILGLCTGFLQVRLWLALDSSQAAMDRTAAEKAAKVAQERALYEAPQRTFEQWWDAQTGDDWMQLWYASHTANDMEPQAWVHDYFEELFSPDAAQAYKDAGFTSAAPVYIIKNGEQPLARVTLTGSDLSWSVSGVELLLTGGKNVTITVPRSCSVTFNGKRIDPQAMQPTGSLLDYEDLREQLQEPVTWVTYSAEGLMAEPEVTVEPPKGCKVFQNDDGAYMLTMDADVSKYTDLTEDFIGAFLNYYMNGYHDTSYNLSMLLDYVYSGTQAYRDIYSTYDSVSWSTYYRTKDTTITVADEAIVWANNCFSIDVSYTAKGTVETDEVLEFADATMRVFFLRTESGDGYYISHFESV